MRAGVVIKVCCLISLLRLGCGLAWAKSDVRGEVEALEQRAEQMCKLDVPGGQPYRLRLHFSFKAAAPQPFEGTLTRIWAAKDKSRTEIHIPGFDGVGVHFGDKLYESRNSPYSPLRLSQLASMWEMSPVPISVERVKRVYDLRKDGKVLRCAEWKMQNGDIYSTCFASDTGVIVNASEHKASGKVNVEYSDYQPFGAKLYPRTMRRFENEQQVIEAHIDELAANSADDSFFKPPLNAEEWAACDGMTPPRVESAPNPEYPRGALGKNATIILSVVVDTGGKLRDIYVLQHADKFDQAAVDAVKRWKFKPALCGSTPVSKRIAVEVNFRTY